MPPPPPDGGHSGRGKRFHDVLTSAVADIVEHGFDSEQRIEYWMTEIRLAAQASMVSERVLSDEINAAMRTTYRKLIERHGILRQHPGISRFTIERVAPRLRAELDRRIMASASLIKLNRSAAVEKTLQRFSGWSTSVPAGGTDVAKRGEVKAGVRKALAQLPFEERRVAIDQGHKFVASLNDILATDGGAIAATWHSHWREAGYNYRPNHKAHDQKVFLIRGCWAQDRGLIKAGAAGYVDEIERPAELPFCRCSYTFIYHLRDLPADMLTAKGAAELKRVRIVANAA